MRVRGALSRRLTASQRIPVLNTLPYPVKPAKTKQTEKRVEAETLMQDFVLCGISSGSVAFKGKWKWPAQRENGGEADGSLVNPLGEPEQEQVK